MPKKFYNTRENRKYLSIVDEYKRYYVTGKSFKIKGAKNCGDLIFKTSVVKLLKDLKALQKVNYDALYSGFKIGTTKYRKKIVVVEYAKDRYFALQYHDQNNNLYRIIIESKSNQSKQLLYREWIKKNTTFFGLNDALGKILMRRSARKKADFLKAHLEQVLLQKEAVPTLAPRDWDKTAQVQKNNKGFLQRKNPTYQQDLAAKYDPNTVAPDDLKSHQHQLIDQAPSKVERERK